MSSEPQAGPVLIWFTKIFTVVMCLGFVAAGVTGMVAGYGEWQLNREAAAWPEAIGKVVSASVKRYDVKTGNQPSSQHHSEMYEVFVDYTFTAEGKSLTKHSTAPRQTPEGENTPEAARAVADSFKPGDAITVFYRPGNPEECRLKRVEVSSAVWLVLGVGGGLTAVLLGGLGIWYMLCVYRG